LHVSLAGSFSTMPFPDLMQWLGDTRRSGTLTVTLELEERFLELEDGRLVAIGSDDPRSRDLARLVLARGLIDEGRLRRAMEVAECTRRRLRRVLVQDGYLTAAALSRAVGAYARDLALELFLWHEGRFAFSSAAQEAHLPGLGWESELVVEPGIPLRELVLEGMRRLDEWRRIAEVLPSDDTLVWALAPAPDLPAVVALAGHAEPVALGDFVLQVGRARFEVLAELHLGWARGVVAVEPAARHETAGRSPVEDLLAAAAQLLAERQYEEAAALLRSILDLDPYHDRARELLHRARVEMLEALYARIPPYRVPTTKIAADSPQAKALAPRERYLFMRIDGRRDVAALTVMTPVGELETLRALEKFERMGLVGMRSP